MSFLPNLGIEIWPNKQNEAFFKFGKINFLQCGVNLLQIPRLLKSNFTHLEVKLEWHDQKWIFLNIFFAEKKYKTFITERVWRRIAQLSRTDHYTKVLATKCQTCTWNFPAKVGIYTLNKGVLRLYRGTCWTPEPRAFWDNFTRLVSQKIL